MRKKPAARLISEKWTTPQTWLVQWPSTMFKWGKSYIAVVHNKQLSSLLTAAKRQRVSPSVKARIEPHVLDALRRAGAIQ